MKTADYKERIEELEIDLEKYMGATKQWCNMAMECANQRRELQAENKLLNQRIVKMDSEIETITALYKGIAEKYRVTENM